MEAITFTILEITGVLGFAIYVISYGVLQGNKISRSNAAYIALNFITAGLVLSCLVASFNLASTLIQVCWVTINLLALIRYRQTRQRSKDLYRWKEEKLSHWSHCA